MTDRFFVYGTLAPGRPNQHILAEVPGTWQPATVRGTLLEEGWGAALGYPGIVLGDTDDSVHGFVFTSDHLPAQWARLDAFEGEGYVRVVVLATLETGEVVQAQIYALAGSNMENKGGDA